MINSDNDYMCERIIIGGAIKKFKLASHALPTKGLRRIEFYVEHLIFKLKHKKKEGKKNHFLTENFRSFDLNWSSSQTDTSLIMCKEHFVIHKILLYC